MFWFVISSLLILLIFIKLYIKTTTGICKSDVKLHGKVAIVTGGNSGIGYETAKDLAKRGATVILACRDITRGTAAADQIAQETGANIVFKQLDLASFISVRKFAADIIKSEPRLEILVNNAGTGKLDNALTEDNLPVEIQINYFGPFLLTTLLLPLLKHSAPSRIINVSSVMHKFGSIDVDKIHKQSENFFQHSKLYSDSKLANILFTIELARRLAGTNVTANSLHPGAVNTEIFRNQPVINRKLIGLIFKNAWEGAQTSIHVAVSPELEGVSGKYFVNCEETATAKKATDEGMASKLWEASERIINKSQSI